MWQSTLMKRDREGGMLRRTKASRTAEASVDEVSVRVELVIFKVASMRYLRCEGEGGEGRPWYETISTLFVGIPFYLLSSTRQATVS